MQKVNILLKCEMGSDATVMKENFAYDVVGGSHHCRIEHGKRNVEVVNLSEQCDYYKCEKEICKPVLYPQGVWSLYSRYNT